MTVAAFHVAAVLLLLVGTGLPPARALVGPGPLAVAVAPLLTALACTAAAILSVALRAPLAPCLVAVVALAWAGSRLVRPAEPAAGVAVGWAQLAGLAATVAVPLLAVRRAPVDWDARSIWFLHADWLWAGGAAAARALGDPAFAFSHPDYPPLAPATVASVWVVLGRDYELAQLTVALLVASATVMLGLAVGAVVRGGPRPAAVLAGGLVVLAAYGLAGTTATNGYAGATATNGYVDLLWAAAFAAGAVLLLRAGPAGARVGAVCLAAAMLTKNEGMVAGTVVLGLAALRLPWRQAARVAVAPVLLAVAWVAVSKGLGAPSDMAGGGRFAALVRLEPDVLARVGPTAAALWAWTHWELLGAAALTVAGLVLARPPGPRPWASTAWVWLAGAAGIGTIGVAYLVSPNDVAWHLRTSVNRTTLAPRLLLLAEGAVWAVALAGVALRHRDTGLPVTPAGAPARPARRAPARPAVLSTALPRSTTPGGRAEGDPVR